MSDALNQIDYVHTARGDEWRKIKRRNDGRWDLKQGRFVQGFEYIQDIAHTPRETMSAFTWVTFNEKTEKETVTEAGILLPPQKVPSQEVLDAVKQALWEVCNE